MNRITRRILHLVVWGCAFFVFATAAWVGFCWLKRPPYLVPDTSAFATGDVFFSVGDAWESVAVRALSGYTSFEVCDSTPSHCGIVIRYADGVRLAHASTVAKKVVMETPEEYLRKNGSYCIYARKAPCAVDTAAVRRTVETLVEQQVPFDFNFDHSSAKALYCTEFVVHVLEQNNCFCFSRLRKRNYMYPNDVLKIISTR